MIFIPDDRAEDLLHQTEEPLPEPDPEAPLVWSQPLIVPRSEQCSTPN